MRVMSEITQELHNSIDNLRREMRHDLRDMRASIQALADVFQESARGVVKVEGEIALMEQKCERFNEKLIILKAEVEALEADVKRLKAERQRLIGSWQALVGVALVASALSTLILKVVEL